MSIDLNNRYKPITGFYRGVVKQHRRQGRCKIFIAGVHDPEWDTPENVNELPSAEQIVPIIAPSNGKDGVFTYPAIGSVVLCGFFNGDVNRPFYMGALLGGKDSNETYTDKARPNVTDAAVQNGTDAYKCYIGVGKSSVTMSETGQIEIKVSSDTNSDSKLANIVIDKDGNIQIKASKNIQIDGESIKITGKTQIDMCSPTINIISQAAPGNVTISGTSVLMHGGSTAKISSPSIALDAKECDGDVGVVIVKGKTDKQTLVV